MLLHVGAICCATIDKESTPTPDQTSVVCHWGRYLKVTIVSYNADRATEQEASMCVVGGGWVGRLGNLCLLHHYFQVLVALAMLLPITEHSWNPGVTPVCKLKIQSPAGPTELSCFSLWLVPESAVLVRSRAVSFSDSSIMCSLGRFAS